MKTNPSEIVLSSKNEKKIMIQTTGHSAIKEVKDKRQYVYLICMEF